MRMNVNLNSFDADGSLIPQRTLGYDDYKALSEELCALNDTLQDCGGFDKERVNYIEPLNPFEYGNLCDRMQTIDRHSIFDFKHNDVHCDFSNIVPASAIKGRKKYVAPRVYVYAWNRALMETIPRAFERLSYMQTLDFEALDAWREDLKELCRQKPHEKGNENLRMTWYLLNLVINSKLGM